MKDKMFQIFDTKENIQLTVIVYKNEPYFLPSELGNALGYENLSHSIRTSDGFIENVDYRVFVGVELSDLKALSLIGNTDKPLFDKFAPSITLITESGIYALALKSGKPNAKTFRVKVTTEILPSIRKHGIYATSETIETMIANPENAIKLLQALQEERKAKEKAIKEKSWINNKRTATAMATASVLKRENSKLKKEMGISKDYASTKAIMIATKSKKEHSWRPLKSYSLVHGYPILKAHDVNYGTINVYHKMAWLNVYNIDTEQIFK